MKIKDFAKQALGPHAWVLSDVVGNYAVNKVEMTDNDEYTIVVTESNGVQYTINTRVGIGGYRTTKVTNEFMGTDRVVIYDRHNDNASVSVWYYTRNNVATPIGVALQKLIAVVARNQ